MPTKLCDSFLDSVRFLAAQAKTGKGKCFASPEFCFASKWRGYQKHRQSGRLPRAKPLRESLHKGAQGLFRDEKHTDAPRGFFEHFIKHIINPIRIDPGIEIVGICTEYCNYTVYMYIKSYQYVPQYCMGFEL